MDAKEKIASAMADVLEREPVISVGRIVHFVIAKYSTHVTCRPAIVVEDWPTSGQVDYVNMQVFTDGSNDGEWATDRHFHATTHERIEDAEPSSTLERVTKRMPHKVAAPRGSATVWETSVHANHAVKVPRTWHWPRECSSLHPALPGHNHAADMIDQHNCAKCREEAKA